jgi:aspartate/tyrosine/aromatic aminotransferase
MLVHRDAKTAQVAIDNLMVLLRGNYSMPPDHGAAVVARILSDPGMHKLWEDELTAMRGRIADLRQAVSAGFRRALGTDEFDYVARQQGMFSLLGLSADQVSLLRDKYGIYMPGDSRTNVAGLQFTQVDRFVDAVAAVSR